jgi:hypothetical protein
VTYANTQSELDGKPIWYWMERFVTAEIMPLPPVEISDADRAVLLQWLRSGAPPRETGVTCDGDGGVLVSDIGTPDGAADAQPVDTLEPSDSTNAEQASDGGQDEAGDAAPDEPD